MEVSQQPQPPQLPKKKKATVEIQDLQDNMNLLLKGKYLPFKGKGHEGADLEKLMLFYHK
jgi:hypothetical protein